MQGRSSVAPAWQQATVIHCARSYRCMRRMQAFRLCGRTLQLHARHAPALDHHVRHLGAKPHVTAQRYQVLPAARRGCCPGSFSERLRRAAHLQAAPAPAATAACQPSPPERLEDAHEPVSAQVRLPRHKRALRQPMGRGREGRRPVTAPAPLSSRLQGARRALPGTTAKPSGAPRARQSGAAWPARGARGRCCARSVWSVCRRSRCLRCGRRGACQGNQPFTAAQPLPWVPRSAACGIPPAPPSP